jgi:hypothetical protein
VERMIYKLFLYGFNHDQRLVKRLEWEFTVRPFCLRKATWYDEIEDRLLRRRVYKKASECAEAEKQLQKVLRRIIHHIFDDKNGQLDDFKKLPIVEGMYEDMTLWKMVPKELEKEDVRTLIGRFMMEDV